MAPEASFIPKNAQSKVKKRVRVNRRIYIFSYISYILFFGTLITAIGISFYVAYLGNTLEATKQQLAVERERFNQSDIERVRDLEKRIILAERLLSETSAPSHIFTVLEDVVIDPVQFTDLSIKRIESGDVQVTFSARSDSLNDAIYQRNQIKAHPLLASASVTGFDYSTGSEDEEGERAQVLLGTDPTLTLQFSNIVGYRALPYNLSVYAPSVALEAAAGTDITESGTTTDATADTVNMDGTGAVDVDSGSQEGGNETNQ